MASHHADLELGRTLTARVTKDAIGLFASALGSASHALFAARKAFADITIARDLAYGPEPAQRLDVWQPRAPSGAAVLFLHGGGFQQLDKASHWAFAERFARMGAVVFNADYRLAPRHRYPAAAQDAARAHAYVVQHAHEYGADPAQLIVSGASAGGNLALGLSLTQRVRAAVLFSGLLQVSDMPRLYRSRASVPYAIRARMASIGCDYPPADAGWTVPPQADPTLDPLLYIERRPARDLPALFVSTGSKDEVLEDSLRLDAHLHGSTVPHELDVLPGFGHAFQGFLFSREVRALWTRIGTFLAAQGLGIQGVTSAGKRSSIAS